MSRKGHTKHKSNKPTSNEYRSIVRKKDKKFVGVLPIRFAKKDVDGNDIIIDSDGRVEDNQW